VTWKDQVNKALVDYQESLVDWQAGHLCVRCISILVPNLTLAQISKVLREVESTHDVSRDEDRCTRCNAEGEVFACD
jgi:uncharacterized protein with PIN domain